MSIAKKYSFFDSHWNLSALATDTPGQLIVFRHNGNALSVDSAQICVLKQTDKVRLGSFLQSKHGRRLKAQIRLEVLSDLADKALERKLTNQ
jgi:hypothetical protein